jgi:hypothetical protein
MRKLGLLVALGLLSLLSLAVAEQAEWLSSYRERARRQARP